MTIENLTKEELLEMINSFEQYPAVTQADDKAFILAYLSDEACAISPKEISDYLSEKYKLTQRVELIKCANINVPKYQYEDLIEKLKLNHCWILETDNEDGYNQVDNDGNALDIIIETCNFIDEDIEVLRNENIDSFILVKE